MRTSELWRSIEQEFGAYGRVLMADVVLSELGGRTGVQAIADGLDARSIWIALCRAQEVPQARWHGRGLITPPGRDAADTAG